MKQRDSVKKNFRRRLSKKRKRNPLIFDLVDEERTQKKRKIDDEIPLDNGGVIQEVVHIQFEDLLRPDPVDLGSTGGKTHPSITTSHTNSSTISDGGEEIETPPKIRRKKKKKKKSHTEEVLRRLDRTINKFYTEEQLFLFKKQTQLRLNNRKVREYEYFKRMVFSSYRNTVEKFPQIGDEEIYKDGLSKMKYNLKILTTYISSISSMRCIHSLLKFFKEEILDLVDDDNLNLQNINIDVRTIKKNFFKEVGIQPIQFRVCKQCNSFHILPEEKSCHRCQRNLSDSYLVHYIPISTILYLMLRVDSMRKEKKLQFGSNSAGQFGVKEGRLYREGRRIFKTNKIFFLNCFTDAFTKNRKHKWCSLMRVLNFSHFKESIEFSKIFLNTLGPDFIKEDIRDLTGFITPMVFELMIASDPANVFTCGKDRFTFFLSTFTLDFEARDKIIHRAFASRCSVCTSRNRMRDGSVQFSHNERGPCCSSEYQGNILHLLSYFNILTDVVPCKLHIFEEGFVKDFLQKIQDTNHTTLIDNLEDFKLVNTHKNLELNKFPYSSAGSGKKNELTLDVLPLIVSHFHESHRDFYFHLHRLIRLLMRQDSCGREVMLTARRLVVCSRQVEGLTITSKLHFCLHFYVYYIYHGSMWLYHGYPGESVFSLAKVMSLATREDVVESRDLFLLRTTIDIMMQFFEVKENKEREKQKNILSLMIGNKYATMLQDNILEFDREEIVRFRIGIGTYFAKILHFVDPLLPKMVCEVFTGYREHETAGGVDVIIPDEYMTRTFPLQELFLEKTVAITNVRSGRVVVKK